MAEHTSEHDAEEATPDGTAPYEAPVVEDLETVHGPAVTAAGQSPS